MDGPTRTIVQPEHGERFAPAPAPRPAYPPAELLMLLRELFADGEATMRIAGRRKLAAGVHRLWLEMEHRALSVVVKRSDPAMARRNRLVAERWLPAVGLEGCGPPLLGVAAERSGERVWQVYEDLGDWILDERAPEPERVEPAVEVIATLHTRFAGHPLLAECRLWGSDYGSHAYGSNVRDAVRALEHLRAPALELCVEHAAVRDRLLERLHGLLAEAPTRARIVAEHGGADTLLHGDLWPKNALVHPTANGSLVRLIDWDRAGVGPASYDLSTFLSRWPASDRAWILDRYRRSVRRAGRSLPSIADSNALFATAEYSRLANLVIWPAIAVWRHHPDRAWAFGELAALAGWLDQVGPLLPE
ncbi:MAG TPA: phosphotransferase [Gemmatimonadaceae bacterium]